MERITGDVHKTAGFTGLTTGKESWASDTDGGIVSLQISRGSEEKHN